MSLFQRVGIIKDGKYLELPNNIKNKGIGKSNVHFFPEGLWREMSYEGVHISSKRQLKEECEKRGQISPYFDIDPRSDQHEESEYQKEKKDKAKKEREGDNH